MYALGPTIFQACCCWLVYGYSQNLCEQKMSVVLCVCFTMLSNAMQLLDAGGWLAVQPAVPVLPRC